MALHDSTTKLHGIAAAPGIAIGPAFWLRAEQEQVQQRTAEPGAELLRLNEARRAARAELEALQAHVAATVSVAEAGIFEAHLVFLDDPTLFDEVESLCRTESCNVEHALATVVDGYRTMLLESDDELFRARADDLQDIKLRLLRLLSGEAAGGLALPSEPCIILADDLLPSTAVQLDRARVLGFCLATGGPTSHVAILARGLGLPAVVGVGAGLAAVANGTPLVVDGNAGLLLAQPDPETQRVYAERLEAERRQRSADKAAAQAPAHTSDGTPIAVLANLSSRAEADEAVACGAEGVGLLRTELLFMERDSAPSEDEQVALYRGIADAMGGRPLVIRTLDIGGDKPVHYLRQPPEQNPALGVRGVRLARSEPELLRAQVRAIWRIGPGRSVKVMFPMVASLEEVRWLRALVDELGAELRAAGEPLLERLDVGVMVEVPALAIVADHVARLVDFMSVGTNDLSQYTLAVDRTNAAVSGLGDALHPAVLRLIARTAEAARAGGAEISVCGELAGDPLGMPLLVGLGVGALSMSSPLIPAAKAALRQLSLDEARSLAAHALDLETAQAVRDYVAAWASGRSQLSIAG